MDIQIAGPETDDRARGDGWRNREKETHEWTENEEG